MFSRFRVSASSSTHRFAASLPPVVAFALSALIMTGCPPEDVDRTPGPNPFGADLAAAYEQMDPALRERGAAVEEGALSGTFAAHVVSSALIDTVIMGQQRGGGVDFRLVTREWDAVAGLYHQRSQLCAGYNFVVAGIAGDPAEDAFAKVPASNNETVRFDHERGVYLGDEHVQLWGIRDLDDPLTDALPANAEQAALAPHNARIYDMDDDGDPAVTLFIDGELEAGTLSGVMFALQRKVTVQAGVAVSADLAYGFVSSTWENVPLASEPESLAAIFGGSGTQHPDAYQSYFEERRIADGASCADVVAALEGDVTDTKAPWLDE